MREKWKHYAYALDYSVESLRVYNCTTGQINPIFWGYGGKLLCENARKYPSKYVMLYPNCTFRKSRAVHKFYEIFYHFLPAILYDVYMKYQGLKPMMLDIAKKCKAAADAGRLVDAWCKLIFENILILDRFFTLNEWLFDVSNVKELMREVRSADDGELFNVGIDRINWQEYVGISVLGTRKFILKDDMNSMPSARNFLDKYGIDFLFCFAFTFDLFLAGCTLENGFIILCWQH